MILMNRVFIYMNIYKGGNGSMLRKEMDTIKQAIINEIEGFEFYQMAAKHAGTEESAAAFMELAAEELKHADYLRQLFDSIKNDREDDFKLAFLENPPSPNIYNWKKVGNKYTSLAMSVFSIGIQMEQASIDFYEEAKRNTENKQARKLYDLLIKWERVHLEEFTAQYNMYKEEWWVHQGFAPF